MKGRINNQFLKFDVKIGKECIAHPVLVVEDVLIVS